MTELNITIKTKCDFDAAHRLIGYEGACSRIHGHKWVVEVSVSGKRFQRNEIGILMDFKTIKSVIDKFDHKTILADDPSNFEIGVVLEDMFEGQVIWLESNPTAENLAMYFWKEFHKIDNRFKYHIKVWESPTSSAEIGDI